MKIRRRGLLLGSASLALTRRAHAAPNPKLLQNRLDLWANYATRTTNMVARLVTTRETSLLNEPLVSTGSLAFLAPSSLVFRDDGRAGSSTLIEDGEVWMLPNRAELAPPRPIDPLQRAAQAWLADRMLRLFAPPKGDDRERAVIEGARVEVPRKSFRLELMPPRGSIIRKTFRSLTVHLDPVVGAVNQAIIAHTQGDRLRLQLSDHRQNILQSDVDAIFDTVRSRTKQADASKRPD